MSARCPHANEAECFCHMTIEERRAEFVRLRKLGMPLQAIADKAGMSIGAIHYNLKAAKYRPSPKRKLVDKNGRKILMRYKKRENKAA